MMMECWRSIRGKLVNMDNLELSNNKIDTSRLFMTSRDSMDLGDGRKQPI